MFIPSITFIRNSRVLRKITPTRITKHTFLRLLLFTAKTNLIHPYNLILETDAKKIDWLKIWPLVKNPYFFSNQPDIHVILPAQELNILIKFHEDWL